MIPIKELPARANLIAAPVLRLPEVLVHEY